MYLETWNRDGAFRFCHAACGFQVSSLLLTTLLAVHISWSLSVVSLLAVQFQCIALQHCFDKTGWGGNLLSPPPQLLIFLILGLVCAALLGSVSLLCCVLPLPPLLLRASTPSLPCNSRACARRHSDHRGSANPYQLIVQISPNYVKDRAGWTLHRVV